MGFRQYFIKHVGLPLTYAYATLRQSVAGNSKFRGIVFCNLDTSKTDISNFVTTWQILQPHILPHVNMVTPTMFPVDKKTTSTQKSLGHKCINSLVSHKLSHDCQFCFLGGGAYGSLPDAAIWWCLRTGGGGVLSSLGGYILSGYVSSKVRYEQIKCRCRWMKLERTGGITQ